MYMYFHLIYFVLKICQCFVENLIQKKPLIKISGFFYDLIRELICRGYAYVRFQSNNVYGYELILVLLQLIRHLQ